MRYRYSRWDDTQDPFGPDIGAADVLDAMSDEVLMGGSADRALQRLMRRGIKGRFTGLDAIRRRLQERRELEASRLDLQGPLEEVREALEQIVSQERETLGETEGEDARFREGLLDSLPPDVPGRVRELQQYRFLDPRAQAAFDAMMERLREQILGAQFRGLAEGMRSADPEQLARLRDMLAELNAMIEKRERGALEPGAFRRFMDAYGDFFPDNPKTLEELLENMARRMAALSSLMASLSQEQRDELRGLADQLMADMDLAFEVDRLNANLMGAFPDLGWGRQVDGQGHGTGSLDQTVDAIERLHDFDELDRALEGEYAGATLEDIDQDALRRTLGEPAVRDLKRLQQIERELESAGLTRRSSGRLEVTPRGVRRMGEKALSKVFDRLHRDREGMHEARDPGGLAEPTGATRPWRFGDHGQLAVQRTVFNAVTRSGIPEAGRGIRLQPEDFEIVESEQRTETATALLLDLSFSMPLRGHLVHAKKMALSLHALIEGRYPRDKLYLIGFSDFARKLNVEDLAASGIERTYGTNMQHAFMLAGRLLAQHPRATRQVIMVTDGEPTAHLEGDEAYFAWPPEPETVRLTLLEAMRLSRSGVILNIFMLEDSPGLGRFMERLARLTSGRVFLMDDTHLGEFVVRDFVARRER